MILREQIKSYVPSHLHLDCCFLLEADENDKLRIKADENSGVKWIDINKAVQLTNEEKMKPIYKKLNEKINKEEVEFTYSTENK